MAIGRANQTPLALQADDGFVVTIPSPATGIADDVNNPSKYGFVLLKNNTASDVTVVVIPAHSPSDGVQLTVLIKSGMVEPISVRSVVSSTGGASSLLAYVGHQGIR